jgi:hypothetical protein
MKKEETNEARRPNLNGNSGGYDHSVGDIKETPETEQARKIDR